VDDYPPMTDGGKNSITVIEKQVWVRLFFLVPAGFAIADGGEEERPVMSGTVGLVDFIFLKGESETRRTDAERGKDTDLVLRF